MIVEIKRINSKKCKDKKCLRMIVNNTVEYEVHHIIEHSGYEFWKVLGPLPGILNTWYKTSKEACDAIVNHNKAIEDELQARQLVMEFS